MKQGFTSQLFVMKQGYNHIFKNITIDFLSSIPNHFQFRQHFFQTISCENWNVIVTTYDKQRHAMTD